MTGQHQRPNPDELLARIQAEDRLQARGRLKIFLGYAAGVGKTYAMLEAAHQRKAEGVDLVVAYIDTHDRAETEAMLQDLEVIPRRQVEYRGRLLPEMDVDAVLTRRPQLALVDELAHTNAPGVRHPKRYQDVQELLDAGVNVYTTLNVQHLESLNDVVAQITGVVVRETIPDSIVDEAAEIELIDLPPVELLQRLKEGKVYVPEQAARAIAKFFRAGNLTALRELVMRRAAERVDDQMRAYMQTRAIPGPWPAKERLLVCVGLSPFSERLVRSARRLADELDAEWFAVYVETSDHHRLPQNQKDRISRTLRLAEELGGKAVTLPGHSVAEAVLEYARKHNVTKIVAGKPIQPRWRELLRGSAMDQIIRHSGPVDVYFISGMPKTKDAVGQQAADWRPHPPWRRYVQSVALVIGGTTLSALVRPFFSPTNLVMIYLLVVVLAALYLGRGPSFLAAILSVLVFDFFFVPPSLTLAIADTEYLLTFAALLVVGLVISSLTVRVREQADAAGHREAQTAELYALSRDLAAAVNLDAILQAILAHIGQTFGREVVVLLPGDSTPGDTIEPQAISPGFALDENQLAVAAWAFKHGQPAGRGTDTLPSVDIRCFPLKTARGVVGVLGVKPAQPGSLLTPDQRDLLQAFASQAALAIERVQLAEQAQRAELLQSEEKLRTTLLNMISHDLRTPLVSITGALSSLQEEDIVYDGATRRSLIENAHEEAERLNRLVGNLLDMTRIEAGALQLAREPTDVQDLIGSALEQAERWLDTPLGVRPVTVDVAMDLPLVAVDFVLMHQVLVNLLDNAVKYSPLDSPIDVRARVDGAELQIQIADRGMGVPPADLERVFDKFYRVRRPGSVSGSGLGLSICKGIVEAHGGRIWAQNREGGGTLVTLALPLNTPEEKTS
jgi:two-component system, OmpR family, sensor histidine kinase KdpD